MVVETGRAWRAEADLGVVVSLEVASWEVE